MFELGREQYLYVYIHHDGCKFQTNFGEKKYRINSTNKFYLKERAVNESQTEEKRRYRRKINSDFNIHTNTYTHIC